MLGIKLKFSRLGIYSREVNSFKDPAVISAPYSLKPCHFQQEPGKNWPCGQRTIKRYPGAQSRQSARLFLQSSESGLPNPSPAGECAPPVLGGGAHSLAREGLESPNSNGGTFTAVPRSNRAVGFAGLGFAFAFVNEISAHGHGIITIFITYHHRQSSSSRNLNSPLVSTLSEIKLFCFFAMVLSSLSGFCYVFDCLVCIKFCNYSLCLKAGMGNSHL